MSGKRVHLARRRRAMGMTQEQLAVALDTDRSTIYRWEAGETTPPPRHQPRLARALGISPGVLVDLLTLNGHHSAQPNGGGRVTHALRHPSSADGATATTLWQAVRGLDERYDRLPATSLLADTGQALGRIDLLAKDGPDAARGELHAVKAAAATLMGQLVWDASQRRDHRSARGYFEQAVAAARAIDSPVAEGHALLRTSYVALYGEHDPVEGLRLTEHTARITRGTSDVLAGLAQLHSAEAHAMLADQARCERALATAEATFGRVTAEDHAAHLFSPNQFDRLAGSCYLALGNHRRAQRILDHAAAGMTAPSKSRAIVLGNLSLAHLHQHDLDAAVLRLHEAIDVLETTRGGGGLNVLSDAVRTLRHWRGQPAVQDVYDRVFSPMTTA